MDVVAESENVQVVRRSVDAFNRRDLELMLQLSHPEAEWYPFRAQLEGVPYRGHEDIRRFWKDMAEDWTEFQVNPVEFHETGDRLVVIGKIHALGRGSGVEVDSMAGFVIDVHEGQLLRLRSYSEPEEALREAGLGR